MKRRYCPHCHDRVIHIYCSSGHYYLGKKQQVYCRICDKQMSIGKTLSSISVKGSSKNKASRDEITRKIIMVLHQSSPSPVARKDLIRKLPYSPSSVDQVLNSLIDQGHVKRLKYALNRNYTYYELAYTKEVQQYL